jgi:hypothetical protein
MIYHGLWGETDRVISSPLARDALRTLYPHYIPATKELCAPTPGIS